MFISVCHSILTITVPDVFIPCSRIATRVKTSIRGPYSSPATFCKTTHMVRALDHIQNRKKSTHINGKKQVLDQGLLIPEESWSCGPESWTRLTWQNTESSYFINIKLFRKCEAPDWKQKFSHPTCCGPEQAPHQNMVSGCQCWHTS